MNASARTYVTRIVGGNIPANRYVRAACQRSLEDHAHTPAGFRYVPRVSNALIRWIETHCVHVKGPQRGNPLKLLPWQKWVLSELAGWRATDGSSRYRRGYLQVGRKSGKTLLSAALAAHELFTSKEGAEVLIVSAGRQTATDQLAAVLREMAKLSPALAGLAEELGFTWVSNSARFETNVGNTLAILSNMPSRGEGYNASLAIVDEYHTHPTDQMLSVIENGQAVRPDPRTLIITTSGDHCDGPAYEEVQRGMELLEQEKPEDLRSFFALYGIESRDDWRDASIYEKAIPSLGHSVRASNLEAQAVLASKSPAQASQFRIKQLCRWENAVSSWLTAEDLERWDAAEKKALPTSGPCWIGADLSSTTDFSVLALLHRSGTGWAARFKCFLPEAQIEDTYLLERDRGLKANRPLYEGWRQSGELLLCEGNRIDVRQVATELLVWAELYGPLCIAADPYNASGVHALLPRDMQERWLEVKPTPDGIGGVLESLPGLVRDGAIAHDGNACARWQLGNARVIVNQGGQYRIAKADAKGGQHYGRRKMDAAVALAIAMRAAQVFQPKRRRSVYAGGEVLV